VSAEGIPYFELDTSDFRPGPPIRIRIQLINEIQRQLLEERQRSPEWQQAYRDAVTRWRSLVYEVTAYYPSSAPIADAGANSNVLTGTEVRLDGSASYDPGGGMLRFDWTTTGVPAGSAAALSDPGRPDPTFVPDVEGDYVFALTVDNGEAASVPDQVTVSAAHIDAPPNASAGRDIAYEYDADGNLISVTDPLGNTARYGYNADGLLTQRTDARGNVVETITYDSFQPPRVASFVEKGETFTVSHFTDRTEKTDSQGNKWTYYYNDVGIIERTVDPLGNETKQNLNKITATSVDWEEDANGNRTSYTYDALGNVTSRTDALGNTWTYNYITGTDRIETETNPLGVVTKYEYDAKGNQTKMIRDYGGALANTTSYTYDAQGNQTSVTDTLGNTTGYEYDAQGNITKITDPSGNVTAYTYDARGNQLTEMDANGNATTFAYDLLDRLVSITDVKGNTTSFQYDANGNLIAEADAQGNNRTQSYDAYNRLTQVTDLLSNTTNYTYDWRDNLIATTDANGNTTSYTYDILDRLLSKTNAVGEQTNFTYDVANNLLTVLDGNGNTTTFSYDALDRVVSETLPDGAQTTYTFDAVGNQATKTDPNGNTTRFAYDSLNRLLTKTYTDGSTANFTYDTLGRMLTGSDSDSSLAYTYDANGRVTQATQNGKTIDYSYDGVGNRTSMTTPEGEVVQYSYDEAALMTSVHLSNAKGITYSYDSLNRITRKDYSGGSYSTYAYDAVGRSIQIDHLKPDGSSIYSQGNVYDGVGNILTKTIGLGPTAYNYDNAYRLTSADHNDWTYNNRNQLLGYDAVSYTYDANGNTLTKTDVAGTTQYSYDYENRLRRVELPDGSFAEYKYDVLGRRIEKNVNGSAISYIYDKGALLAEYNDPGPPERAYIRGSGDINPSFWTKDNEIFFFHHDQLGTPSATTNDGASVIWEATYDAFGEADILTEIVGNNVRFPGQYFDTETGTHYNYFRDYVPNIGRYIESDPIKLIGGINTYVYAKNNPTTLIDPFGLKSLPECFKELRDCQWKLNKGLVQCGANAVGPPLAGELACVAACAAGSLLCKIGWAACFKICLVVCTGGNTIWVLKKFGTISYGLNLRHNSGGFSCGRPPWRAPNLGTYIPD